MNYIQNSFFFSLVFRFWDWVCRVFPTGLFGAFFRGIGKLFRRGLVCRLLNYESRLDRLWQASFVRRLCDGILNLIPNLFYRFTRRFSSTFDSSYFYRAVCAVGDRTPLLFALLLLMLLCVPQTMWNNLYSLAGAVGITLLFYVSGTLNKAMRLDTGSLGFWPILFFLVSCLSFFWSEYPSLSLRHFFFTVTCIIIVVVFVSSVEKEDQLYRVAFFCAVGLCVCCAYAMVQRLLGVEVDNKLTDVSANAGMPGRVYSFFENANAFANVLVYFMPLMFALTFYAKKNWHRLIFALAFVLGFAAILMTFSRGGWLALAVAGLMLALFMCPRWVPLFILLVAATVPFWPDTISNRILSIFSSDTSIGSRSLIYTAAAQLIEENPIGGVGLGSSAFQAGVKANGAYANGFSFSHAHNIYMEIWCESGVIALAAFLFAMFFPIRDGARAALRSPNKRLGMMAAACASGVVGSMVFGITDCAWVYPRVMTLFWFLFAMLCAAIKLYRKNLGENAGKEGNIHD